MGRTKEDVDDIIEHIDKELFFNGTKYYSITLRGLRKEFIIYPEVFGNTERKSIFVITQQLRGIIYGFLLGKTEVEEHIQIGKSLEKITTQTVQLISLDKLKTISLQEKIDLLINQLFTEIHESNEIIKLKTYISTIILDNESMNDDFDTWKIVLLITLFYLKQYGDYSQVELVKCFTSWIYNIYKGKESVVQQTKDSRESIHMFSACQVVFFCLYELFIDYFNMNQSMFRTLYVPPLEFCNCYDTVSLSTFKLASEIGLIDIIEIFDSILYPLEWFKK